MDTGDRLGRYELGRPLGRGAMSEVFISRHPLLEREVAIKLLKSEWRRDPGYLARFLEDARAAHALNHPNIVRVLDVDDLHEQPFIVMDLVEGQPLDTWCKAQVDVLAATKVARDVASALAAAHADGLIHRDVKPSNILIETRTGSAKLTDFGAAKRIRAGDADLTQGGRIGTPRYMAPEQIEGFQVSPQTDLFALGATLYELLAGRPAFEGESLAAVFSGILLKDPPALKQVRADVPAPLADLVQRLLAKTPEDRPGSAEDVLAILDRLAQVVLPLQALPVETFGPGALLMAAGSISNRIMILKEGALEISKDGVHLGEVDEPGSIFGELAVLLRCPHTADVRTIRTSALHIADAQSFLQEHPGVTLYVATGLAQRLEAMDARLLAMRLELDSGDKRPDGVSRMLDAVHGSLRSMLR